MFSKKKKKKMYQIELIQIKHINFIFTVLI